jgi:hypothetical protein
MGIAESVKAPHGLGMPTISSPVPLLMLVVARLSKPAKRMLELVELMPSAQCHRSKL